MNSPYLKSNTKHSQLISVEKVEIDLTQYNVGDMIHVKDLPLAANSKISLVTPEDTLIVNIAEPEAVPEDEDEEAAEE